MRAEREGGSRRVGGCNVTVARDQGLAVRRRDVKVSGQRLLENPLGYNFTIRIVIGH